MLKFTLNKRKRKSKSNEIGNFIFFCYFQNPYKRCRTISARAKHEKTKNWWVELQQHYMTAKDHQDMMFDEARIAEREESAQKFIEQMDEMRGIGQGKKKFNMDEHIVDEEGGESDDLPPEPPLIKTKSKPKPRPKAVKKR